MAEKRSRSESRPPRDAAPIERGPKIQITKISAGGKAYIDYKEIETLKKLTSSNAKLQSRKRNSATALEQRLLAQAVKRARHMALLPYVNTSQS